MCKVFILLKMNLKTSSKRPLPWISKCVRTKGEFVHVEKKKDKPYKKKKPVPKAQGQPLPVDKPKQCPVAFGTFFSFFPSQKYLERVTYCSLKHFQSWKITPEVIPEELQLWLF